MTFQEGNMVKNMTFQKDDIVKVVKHGLWSTGRQGTVIKVQKNRVDVIFDSGFYGKILTFKPSSLRLAISASDSGIYNYEHNNIKGENNMLMGNYTVCKVKFIEGTNANKEYHYALYDDNICIDDYVVVKSANHGMGIARVTDIVPDGNVTQAMRDYCNEGREVISKFDMGAYEQRVEKRKIAKQLKADMNKKMKEMQELAMFEMMAEKNPELKEMLDKYKELIG